VTAAVALTLSPACVADTLALTPAEGAAAKGSFARASKPSIV